MITILNCFAFFLPGFVFFAEVVPVPLNNVNEIVNSGVAAQRDVGIRNPEKESSTDAKNHSLPVFPKDLLD